MQERHNNLPKLKYFRRKLRSSLTPAEATLWKHLSRKQLDGKKFRQQHSVSDYVLDFYCPSEKLAIELDGSSHNSAMAAEYDHERTLFLEQFGIRVLRFENRTVFEATDWLLEQIKSEFRDER